MSKENIRQDVNGSTDKPFPQERNFVIDAEATSHTGKGIYVPSKDFGDDISLGQVKYARREGAVSIYKDVTRNTENDNDASRKAEKAGSIFEPDIEEEEGGSASV